MREGRVSAGNAGCSRLIAQREGGREGVSGRGGE